MLIDDERQLALLPDLPWARTRPPTSLLEPLIPRVVNRLRPDVVFCPLQTSGSWGVGTGSCYAARPHLLPPPDAARRVRVVGPAGLAAALRELRAAAAAAEPGGRDRDRVRDGGRRDRGAPPDPPPGDRRAERGRRRAAAPPPRPGRASARSSTWARSSATRTCRRSCAPPRCCPGGPCTSRAGSVPASARRSSRSRPRRGRLPRVPRRRRRRRVRAAARRGDGARDRVARRGIRPAGRGGDAARRAGRAHRRADLPRGRRRAPRSTRRPATPARSRPRSAASRTRGSGRAARPRRSRRPARYSWDASAARLLPVLERVAAARR